MLAVLTTDAAATPEVLGAALRAAVDHSFNALIVDGCTSTNDTVIALASGAAGAADAPDLTATLTDACADLAWQLAVDSEGSTRVAEIRVVGAADDADARLAARAVASSLLVKVSLFGADPYWGRIFSELGASGAAFDPDRVRVPDAADVDASFDDGGVGDAAAAYLAGERLEITCDLGLGAGTARVLATDLGHGYIEENMRTS